MDDHFFHYRQIKAYQEIPPNTIDDDVLDTLGRQFSAMGYKFSYVLCPRSQGVEKLKNWDLWGPFFMCLVFGIFINSTDLLNQMQLNLQSYLEQLSEGQ